MATSSEQVVVIGAGINGLTAANYLQRAGFAVTVVERAERVGGACVSATAEIDGIRQDYALGASVLGLMQGFVFEETGLAERLETFVPNLPKLVYFPGDGQPTRIFRDARELERELADRWGERGSIEAFRADGARVVDYLQAGYRSATPPSLHDASRELGDDLAKLWIRGSAMDLLDHYFTAERTKLYMAMTVTESGPVSLHEPYSAFTIPLMDSGSIFDGYYGFVRDGIWRVTEELGRINSDLGIRTFLDATVETVDSDACAVNCLHGGELFRLPYDHLVFATDPCTAARLLGDRPLMDTTARQRLTGSSGKLNLMFRNPVRWKHAADGPAGDTAFRFRFAVDSIEQFEQATLSVVDDDVAYAPGYLQVYCEGAAMRQLGLAEPFDRLAVFFKNLALDKSGDELPEVESAAKEAILELVDNAGDCAWSRLLAPRDLQETFLFPGGNLDHTMLVGGQTFAERGYSADRERRFYDMANHANVHLCGAGAYPCGSVAGTPGYMCARQLIAGSDD